MRKPVHLAEDDLHPHLRNRMAQRGVTLPESEQTLADGWRASHARPGMFGMDTAAIEASTQEWNR